MDDLGPLNADETYVYFFQAEHGGPIKVGQSVDPSKRIGELQTGNPYKLVARRVVKGDPFDEFRLHDLFRAYRLEGEWFRAHPALAAMCDAIPDPDLADEPLESPDTVTGGLATLQRWQDPAYQHRMAVNVALREWRNSPNYKPELPPMRLVRG